MVVAKWHVRRTSGAPKALAVALSFCRLLGLGCPKQALAKIATPRWKLRLDWDLKTTANIITIHKKLSGSLANILLQTYDICSGQLKPDTLI